MPWFILKDSVDSSSIDGINKRRAMCAPNEELALFSVTGQGVIAKLDDVKAVDGTQAMRYVYGHASWEDTF